jgi:TRAP transporter TAXI family solute receptor
MLRKLTIAFSLLLSTTAVAADTAHMGIATGEKSGTYYQVGNDLSRLVAREQIRLDVLATRGSVENLVTLWDRRSIQLAIAQSDVLVFMSELGDEKARDLISDIRVALPLYTEEAHLVARKGISSFADLNGKRLAIGMPGSGTSMTAEVFLELTGVEPALVVRGPLEEALQALRAGDLDAMMVIAGSPMRLLTENISPDDNLHLVPMGDVDRLRDVYGKPVVIPATTYRWQSEPVETVGVIAALMTMDYPADSDECNNVRRVTEFIRNDINWLNTKGHEKWAEVDLDFPVAAEVRSSCSALFE